MTCFGRKTFKRSSSKDGAPNYSKSAYDDALESNVCLNFQKRDLFN